MKRMLQISCLVLLEMNFFACSKKNNTSTTTVLSETPTAKSTYDNSNLGIYKGVFVGSSGTIVLDISNSGTISARLKIDNSVYNFTTNQVLQPNQSTSLTFTNGNDHFTFSVDANGANPTITNLIINGHNNPAIIVLKETSTDIVKCYEGSFTGGDAGVFNAAIRNSSIQALIKSNVFGSNYTATGTIHNNQIAASGTVSSSATFIGTVNGNSIYGTWTNTLANLKGNWTG